jgi:hypothetical protein
MTEPVQPQYTMRRESHKSVGRLSTTEERPETEGGGGGSYNEGSGYTPHVPALPGFYHDQRQGLPVL